MEKEKKLAKMRNNKLLCYCSKVTYQKFTLEIKGASVTKLDSICNKLKLAKYCSACLPNIEDEFFRLTGKKDSIKIFGNPKLRLSKKYHVKNFLKDHRVFMLSVIAALTLGGKWKINDRNAINSSFPTFLKISKELGGKIN